MRTPPALYGLLALSVTFALGADTKPNLTGTWKANIAKSTFGAFPAPQSSITKIDHQDPKLKITNISVGDQGERTMEFTFSTDGTETTNQIGNVEIRSKGRWEGKVLLIDSQANAGGDVITVKDRWTLSDDGKTMTLVRVFSGPQGETTQTVISDKQ